MRKGRVECGREELSVKGEVECRRGEFSRRRGRLSVEGGS